jgi:hypothetical protein
LQKPRRLTVNQAVLDWSRSDPEGFLAAASGIIANEPTEKRPDIERLLRLIGVEPNSDRPTVRRDLLDQLLESRPGALLEAVSIINHHRDQVVAVMTRFGYTDHRLIGGFLDEDFASRAETATSSATPPN